MSVNPRFPTYVRGHVSIADDTPREASSTVTSVSGATSSTSLLAVNTNRLGAAFYNDSSADLYLKCGATASTSSFTVKIAANSYYELPRLADPHAVWRGAVDGIWSSATGAVRITEFARS